MAKLTRAAAALVLAGLVHFTVPAHGAERPDGTAATPPRGGIPWFPTWQGGLREAQRTGKPILLISGTPHCAGVSGTW